METLLIYLILIALPVIIGLLVTIISSIYYFLKIQKLRPKILAVDLQIYESRFSNQVDRYNEVKQNIDSFKKMINDKQNIKESIWYYISNDSDHQKSKTKRHKKTRSNKYRRY